MAEDVKDIVAVDDNSMFEIPVTEEDKYGTDIALMSDFFGIYIEQLSAELSTQVVSDILDDILVADIQILGELVRGGDILLQGKYGYIPDFDNLPNDIKMKLRKGIYTLGESRQVEGNVRAVVLDEEGTTTMLAQEKIECLPEKVEAIMDAFRHFNLI